jgi:UDP-N-acetylmuramate dehydrogenase
MAAADVLTHLKDFGDIVQANVPLGPFTLLKLGGPAEALARPRSFSELAALIKRCQEKQIPVRVLGGGGNLLIREEGVRGVVIHLNAPAFTHVAIQGQRVRAGCGAPLSQLIAATVRNGLAGLETLAGRPGTVGGALRNNAGERAGEIGQYVHSVEVLDAAGKVQTREKDELRFHYLGSNLDDPVLLTAEFELEPDHRDAVVKRLRKAWILRKAHEPFSYQHAGRLFKDPPGLSASALIEQAGLVGTRVGGALVSDRDANYVVVEAGANARDVLRLIELIQARVEERFHVELDPELSVW